MSAPYPSWWRRVHHWLWDGPAPDWITSPVLKLLCRLWHHELIDDQCGKPEHRFCVWCNTTLPHALIDGTPEASNG